MTLNDYQQQARVFNGVKGDTHNHALFGLAEEVGELLGLFKRLERGDLNAKQVIDDKLIYELGDILWYVSDIATNYGMSLDYVAEQNISKLKDRMNRGVIQGSGDR